MKLLGYSSYTNEQQYLNISASYKKISEIVEKAQMDKNYGEGLNTLLIFYNFEAVPNEFVETNFLKQKYEVQRYNLREKSLRINIFVGFDEVTSMTYEEQIVFYYHTTMQALEMVKEKFAKRKRREIEIDFDKLYGDIKKAYLTNFSWLEDR